MSCVDRLHEKVVRLIHSRKNYEQGSRVYIDVNDLYSAYNILPL